MVTHKFNVKYVLRSEHTERDIRCEFARDEGNETATMALLVTVHTESDKNIATGFYSERFL